MRMPYIQVLKGIAIRAFHGGASACAIQTRPVLPEGPVQSPVDPIYIPRTSRGGSPLELEPSRYAARCSYRHRERLPGPCG